MEHAESNAQNAKRLRARLQMDTKIGQMLQKLEDHSLYAQTLIVFSSDNGGQIEGNSNNYPLRGGKHSNFEGGVRVAAFVSGGVVPRAVRGSRSEALIGLEDWYATFAAVAGVGAAALVDKRAAAAGLPPIDSINQWGYLTGAVRDAPRAELPLGDCANSGSVHERLCGGEDPGDTTASGLVARVDGSLYKLLLGIVHLDCSTEAVHPTVLFSKKTFHLNCPSLDCGADGCLHNLTADETETTNLNPPGGPTPSRGVAAVLAHMRARMRVHNATVFNPRRGKAAIEPACEWAVSRYNGTWGPWLR